MSVMDVQIEPQTELLSRIQLAIAYQSKLCFLHGVSGAGKSHLVNLLIEQSTDYCVRLNYRRNNNPDQVKQQLICELAGENFTELSQPLLSVVEQRIEHYQHSVLIVVDNASDLPNDDIALLWHAVNDFSRKHPKGLSFSVVLVGESDWAVPFYSALNESSNSPVVDFKLKPLSLEQARTFMLAVHAQWSDEKVEKFLKGLTPQYFLPKQLIYGTENFGAKRSNSLALWLSASLAIVISAFAISYWLSQSVGELNMESRPLNPLLSLPDSTEEASIGSPATQVNEFAMTENVDDVSVDKLVVNSTDEIVDEMSNEPAEQANLEDSADAPSELVELLVNDHVAVSENEFFEQSKAVLDESSRLTPVVAPITETVVQYTQIGLDGEDLLSVPASSYGLMLGGYSQLATLRRVRGEISDFSSIYQYKTIRNGKPWYVLLYGRFATKTAANEALQALPSRIAAFSPWSKSYRLIHQEIAVLAPNNTDNK